MLTAKHVSVDLGSVQTKSVKANSLSAKTVSVPVTQIFYGSGGSPYAVLFVPQELTKDQQNQAQINIGLGEMNPSPVEIYEEAKNGTF